MDKIDWKTEWIGGSLQGYFCGPWSFEETVGRLITLSGQPAKSFDEYKTSVEFRGRWNGQPFTLYDYKEDREIHVGGDSKLDVKSLCGQLAKELVTVEPTAYTAAEHYDEEVGHSWPVKDEING